MSQIMAIGGSTISLSTIAGEYGGSTPHSLSEYYRGGGLVPVVSTTSILWYNRFSRFSKHQ